MFSFLTFPLCFVAMVFSINTCRMSSLTVSQPFPRIRPSNRSNKLSKVCCYLGSSPPNATNKTKIRFTLPLHVEFGESVALVGSEIVLGQWNLDKGIALTWSQGDVWQAEVELEAGTEVQYKYVVKSGTSAKWQDGDDFALCVPTDVSGALEVDDTWTAANRLHFMDCSNNSYTDSTPSQDGSVAVTAVPAADPVHDVSERVSGSINSAVEQSLPAPGILSAMSQPHLTSAAEPQAPETVLSTITATAAQPELPATMAASTSSAGNASAAKRTTAKLVPQETSRSAGAPRASVSVSDDPVLSNPGTTSRIPQAPEKHAEAMSLKELKSALKQLKLPQSGRKADLIKRLLAAQQGMAAKRPQ